MPKFKIELELNNINERILIADYDSSTNSNETLTFNEQFQASENDVFNLTFDISDNLGRPNINIGSLINVGRPIWLYTYNPDRAIRMVVTSVSTVIGSKNVIYQVSSTDYASFVFARNNVGLNLNTITDRNFLNWLEDSSYTQTNINSIGTYILERGWLRNSSGDGWSISSNVSIIFNVNLSSSNTYNGLVEMAKLTNTNLKIDYINQIFYFISREDQNLDKNYLLDRSFNINQFGVTYSGENLYSLLYLNGGEDEFGNVITLGQVTEYLDSFIEPDLNYFVNANLITSSEATNIVDTEIKTNLKTINENLQQAIVDRFTAETQISDMRAKIEAEAEQIILSENIETFSEKYNALNSLFQTYRKDEIKSEVFSISTSPIQVLINNLPFGANNYSLDYPCKVSYDGRLETVVDSNYKIGGEFKLLFENSGSLTTYTQNGINFFLDFSDANSNFIFDSNKLNIIDSKATYSEEYTNDVYEVIYPFLEKLDLYNGSDAIQAEKNRIQDIIDFYKSEWDKDYLHLQCLNGDESGESCSGFYIPSQETLKNGVIESIIQRLDDYKLVIGGYNPDTKTLSTTELGKYTLIKKLLNDYDSLYTTKTGVDRQLPVYKSAVNSKQNFWYNLKENRQHIFQEGYYENTSYGTADQLFLQGEFIYEDHKVPNSSLNVSYINISDIIGKNVNEIEVGDFIHIREDKINFFDEETQLKVAGFSKSLRNDKDIKINIFRYNLYDTILEKIMASNQ